MNYPLITFSHQYSKLYHNKELISHAMLILVQIINLEDMHHQFIDYDTDEGKYKLPNKGQYLLLLFKKNRYQPNLFTTLRCHTTEKEAYYKSKVGEVFTIKFTE